MRDVEAIYSARYKQKEAVIEVNDYLGKESAFRLILNENVYDGEGSAALCGIKEVGGITIAQKLDTAKQPDMPEGAIESGCMDFVLSPGGYRSRNCTNFARSGTGNGI
jgi:hypothetical protein